MRGGSGRRRPFGGALARLAVRMVVANKMSTALVILLLASPLALATASLSLSASLNRTDAEVLQAELGNATLRARGDVAAADLPSGSAVARVTRSRLDLGAGDLDALPLVSASGDLALARSRQSLLAGRWPAGETEIALTPDAAARLGVAVGDRLPAFDDGVVVGAYRSLRDRQAVEGFTVAAGDPASGAARGSAETLVLLPRAADPADVASALRSSGASVETRADVVDDRSNAVSPELAVAQWTVILVQLALLVGAIFAVLRERDRPTTVLLHELGATRAHAAELALLRGCGLTLVAALLGLTTGAALGELGRRVIGRSQPYVSEALRLPVGALAALVALTLLLGAVAAASFLRPTADTTGPVPIGRVSLHGGVLALVGLVTSRLAIGSDGPVATIVLISGCAAVALGASIAGAGLLAHIARWARGPASVRIALRDIGRRSAHLRALVVAAVTGLVGATMALVALSSHEAEERARYRPVLAEGQALVTDASDQRARALATALGPRRWLQLGAALGPDGELVRTERSDGSRGFVAVVDPDDLPLVTADAPVQDGRAVLLNPEVRAAAQVTLHAETAQGERWSTDVPVTPLPSPRRGDSRLPDVAIGEDHAARIGLREDPDSGLWLYDMGRPLTDADRTTIDTFVPPGDAASVIVERGYVDRNADLRRALGFGLVVFGVLTTVAVVVLGETQRAELRALLHDLGAPPRLARRLPVSSAAYLSSSFVVIATGIAVPLAALALEDTPLTVDWPVLAGGSLATVLAAVAAAGLIGRRTGRLDPR